MGADLGYIGRLRDAARSREEELVDNGADVDSPDVAYAQGVADALFHLSGNPMGHAVNVEQAAATMSQFATILRHL